MESITFGNKIYDNIKNKNKNRNFIAGLDVEKNISRPLEGGNLAYYGQYESYISLRNPNGLVVVDRNYLIEHIDEIVKWCKNPDEKGVIKDCCL